MSDCGLIYWQLLSVGSEFHMIYLFCSEDNGAGNLIQMWRCFEVWIYALVSSFSSVREEGQR